MAIILGTEEIPGGLCQHQGSLGAWQGFDFAGPWAHGVGGSPQADDPPGALFQDPGPGTSHSAFCHRCPSQSPLHVTVGSGILQPLRIVPQVTLRAALGARVETPVTRTGAASGSTCLC